MQLVSNLEDLTQAWQRGAIVLHPTDTLPGLIFCPELEHSWQAFMSLKGRPQGQTCIVFQASAARAFQSWQPLPTGWQDLLSELWPGPLSVIWQAAEHVPKTLVRDDGSIAIRVPSPAGEHTWLSELLDRLAQPFPSSSVNRSGEPSITSWQAALDWLRLFPGDCVAPAWVSPVSKPPGQASTLIAIKDDIGKPHAYQLLRDGAYPQERIDQQILKISQRGLR